MDISLARLIQFTNCWDVILVNPTTEYVKEIHDLCKDIHINVYVIFTSINDDNTKIMNDITIFDTVRFIKFIPNDGPNFNDASEIFNKMGLYIFNNLTDMKETDVDIIEFDISNETYCKTEKCSDDRDSKRSDSDGDCNSDYASDTEEYKKQTVYLSEHSIILSNTNRLLSLETTNAKQIQINDKFSLVTFTNPNSNDFTYLFKRTYKDSLSHSWTEYSDKFINSDTGRLLYYDFINKNMIILTDEKIIGVIHKNYIKWSNDTMWDIV